MFSSAAAYIHRRMREDYGQRALDFRLGWWFDTPVEVYKPPTCAERQFHLEREAA